MQGRQLPVQRLRFLWTVQEEGKAGFYKQEARLHKQEAGLYKKKVGFYKESLELDIENEYFWKKTNNFRKKMRKDLVDSKKSSTFALAYQKW